MFYLRKITRGKWPRESQIAQATLKDIEADTVLAEFKTDKNKLSVWKIENDIDLNDAFIALGSSCSNIGSICAVKISSDDLVDMDYDNEEGDTPTIGINHKHRNITGLNFVSLGTVISSVLICFKVDGRVVKKSKPEMKKILADAYKNNRLVISNLNENLLNEIKREVYKTSPIT